MRTPSFPQPFAHQHAPVRNVNEILEEQQTFGQRAADRTTKVMGSWRFIIVQSLILVLWVILNAVAWTKHWDPYPFILMNLVLSLQAAYTAPIIMMSQNRQAMRDRLDAHNDYQINEKAEEEVRAILDHLAAQDQALAQVHELLLALQTQSREQLRDEVKA
ncbi:MAG: DUF1003 domain-containing protein [Anaerolineae bacterium]